MAGTQRQSAGGNEAVTARKEFARKTKALRFAHAKGHCEYCTLKITGKPEYDHFREAGDGGDATFENCRVACRPCHAAKTKVYVQERRKAERVRDKASGALRSQQPFRKSEPQHTATRVSGKTVARVGLYTGKA